MALTAMGVTLTNQHRLQQIGVRSAVLRNLQLLWPMFRPEDFDTFDAFSRLGATLIRAGNQASAALAARYLVALRAIEEQPDETPPVIAPPPPVDVIRDNLRANGLVGTLNALRAGLPLAGAAANGWVRAAGTASSFVLHGGRDTIVATVKKDPYCIGWERVTGADPCEFCSMLADRGPVYSEGTADFESHDHCACEPSPVFAGR